MSRDIQDRLALFGSTAEVHRIALNFDQVEELHSAAQPGQGHRLALRGLSGLARGRELRHQK